jgi:hypothetical protein
MKYFIAGGGEYGTMYLAKLEKAHTKHKICVDEIVVVDKNINVETVGYFFCKHHCDADGYEVGGISMKTIFQEADRIFQVAAKGHGVFGIATLSSCHGVLNLYEVHKEHKC